MQMGKRLQSTGKIGILIAALYLIMPQFAWSETKAVPVASGAIVRDVARLTFEWPKETRLNASVQGNRLTVTFDRKADPNFTPLLRALYPYITGAERKADGKTLVFTLDKPYAIRMFASDTINGVELLGVDLGAHTGPGKQLAALAPAAGEETAEEPQAEVPAATAEEVPAPEGEAKTEPSPEAVGDANPQPMAAEPERPKDRVVIGVSAAEDNAILRFPFPERMAVAAFIRDRFLWIAWDKKLPPDLTDFETLPRTVIGKASVIPSENATVIRMPVDDGMQISVAKEGDKFDWAVLVTGKKRDLAKELSVQVNTDPPAPAHVFVPALETSDPIFLVDPLIGDQLIITPFFSVSEGMAIKRDFIEFTLLPSAQGLAVLKKADDADVTLLRNGLRITVPKGATLTPGLPPIDHAKLAGASQKSVTLFPYDFWKPDAEKREEQLRALFHRIVESEELQDANDARVRTAQIHLSQGMAAEAIAFLDGINRTNPAFYRSNKLAALRGAANFLMYRFTDAARDFAAAELNNNKEIDYWRSMLSDLLGNPDQNYDYLALNNDYISKYPPIFRQRLAIVAADRAVGGKDYNTALKIFDTLTQDNLIEPISAYVNFLMAKISAETGQEKEALETWDKLAGDFSHPFVQSRAEFSRILWEIDHNTLPKEQVINRLEKLRLAWHGDSLELNILTMLGDMYAEQKNYVDAMRIWNGGVISFPNTAAAIDMARKMQEAFITMFNEGLADQLPPLESLALYYEYRSYTPTGKVGNEIINRLADRLVTVDLLDQAAALLENQMRHQAEKEKRSETGAKLATVYLFNHQPAKALQALQDSVYGDNPLMLRLLRNRLTAQALIDMGQYDKALAALGQDNSQDAEHIRIGIYWKEKNWPMLINSIENMLKTRKDITAPVTVEESEYLLRLALAYVFQNDRVQLQYLNDYFGPLMANNPNKDVFQFITGGDISLTTTNFDQVMKNIVDTRTFIDNYHARVDTVGLSGITKP
jgi:tetratricopeptide (TPR) repeat protein